MRHVAVYGIYLLGAIAAARLAFRPPFATKWRSWLVIAGLLAMSAVAITFITDTPWFGDFQSAYYPAGQLIVSAPDRLYGNDCTEGFVNIPVLAVPFLGISALEYGSAVTVFTVIGIVAVLVSMWLLMILYARDATDKLRIMTLFALNGPLMYSIREGNSTHIVLLLVTLAFAVFSIGGGLLAGVLLGIATAVKLPLGLFAVYFFFRRQWMPVAGFAASIAAIAGSSLAVYGMPLHALWYERCVVPYSGKPMPAFNVQSVYGFVARWYGGDVFSWVPLVPDASFLVMRTVLIGALIACVGVVWLHVSKPIRESDFHLEMSMVLVLALTVFPLSWTHYYLFLLVPLTLLVTGRIRVPRNGFWIASAAVAAVAISLPLRAVHVGNPFVNMIIDRLVVSHYLYGGVLLLGILLKVRLDVDPARRAYSSSADSASRVLPQTGSRRVRMEIVRQKSRETFYE